MEVGELFLSGSSLDHPIAASALSEGDGDAAREGRGGAVAVISRDGRLGSAAGGLVSVDSRTGTLRAPRIGAHEVVGDVDFLGNGVRNAVLESPDIR